EARARHYLVIGPWDHAGTRTPRDEVGGVKFGPASLVDLPHLHLDWYRWQMQDGPRPEFLKKAVSYYVSVADVWRYADSLEAAPADVMPMYLASSGNGASDVLAAGALTPDAAAAKGAPDQYLYDPRDVSIAALESEIDPSSLTDQRLIQARGGHELI